MYLKRQTRRACLNQPARKQGAGRPERARCPIRFENRACAKPPRHRARGRAWTSLHLPHPCLEGKQRGARWRAPRGRAQMPPRTGAARRQALRPRPRPRPRRYRRRGRGGRARPGPCRRRSAARGMRRRAKGGREGGSIAVAAVFFFYCGKGGAGGRNLVFSMVTACSSGSVHW